MDGGASGTTATGTGDVGQCVNSTRMEGKISGEDYVKPNQLPKDTRLMMAACCKGSSCCSTNQDNKFAIVDKQLEVEMELDTVGGANESMVNHQSNPEATNSGVELGKETLETQGGGTEMVNLSVSHVGLANNMKGLGGVTVNDSAQAQNQDRGPRKSNDKSLKEITNKLSAWPTISKPTRPIT